MANGRRFIVKHNEGTFKTTRIIVDRETGVNYLFHQEGYGGGLTVLLDREGKPVVSPLPVEE